MSSPQLSHAIEALLFVSPEPLTIPKLAKLTAAEPDAISEALRDLSQRLTGGIRLANAGKSYQLVTAPEVSTIIKQYESDSSRQDLTKAALETLSIVAYRGPITKSEIDAIRGVASDAMLRGLIARGLVNESGRADSPGRPIQYVVSHLFLQSFGLTSTKDLPSLPTTESEATP